MKFIGLTLIALIAFTGCASKQSSGKGMDEKRYNRQINDAQKSIENIDN